MRIIPVIDLKGGHVVRAVAGRREEYRPIDSELTRSSDPFTVCVFLRDRFRARELYCADLDAIGGAKPDHATYDRMALGLDRLWVDAGVRELPRALELREHGLGVVLGLESLAGPEVLVQALERMPPASLAFSLDLKDGKPLTNASWVGRSAGDIANHVLRLGVCKLIVLDLAQVGTGRGPAQNVLNLCTELHQAWPEVELVTGGGVRHVADLKLLESHGVSAALVASALHDGRIRPEDLSPTYGTRSRHQ